MPFLLPESCRWLIANDKKDKVQGASDKELHLHNTRVAYLQAIQILKRIAKFNKKTVSDDVWDQVGRFCEKQRQLQLR